MPHEELVQKIAEAVEERRKNRANEKPVDALWAVVTEMCPSFTHDERDEIKTEVETVLLFRVFERAQVRAMKKGRPHSRQSHFLEDLENRQDEIRLDQAS
jgi:hypothetical protein